MATAVVSGRVDERVKEEEFREKRRRFAEFLEFVHSLPPAPEWLSTATDEELRDMIVDEMLEKERRFVGGDRYVPVAD